MNLDFSILATADGWISLATLTLMEIILGVDNVLFISILVGRLDAKHQSRARLVGISLALLIRIGLLLAISWVLGLQQPLFHLWGWHATWRGLILLGGGLFLLYKATTEIHDNVKGIEEGHTHETGPKLSMGSAILQIVAIDIVFSFDSILTAVTLVENVALMVIAVVISMAIMLWSAKPIGKFIEKHPTVKMLALSFLMLIGVLLVLDAFEVEVPRGYIYFALFFSLTVEVLNMRIRKRTTKQRVKD